MKTIFSFAAAAVAGVQGKAMVGTNLGGWQVLEPWITPSLFYRFLGKTQSEGVGMDQYTLCEALGPEEGNRVLQAHWQNWVTEDLIKDLADREVEVVRLPIGDWTLKQYGPYVGCTDGAKDHIQWLLDTADKHGIKVLLDVHAVKDSQNGFDNSGMAYEIVWTDEEHFYHNGNSRWMGPWNGSSYDFIDYDNINWAIDTVKGLLEEWGDHPAFYALEPVNEPWWCSDLPTLKDFYRSVRNMMRESHPDILFVFHDSFHFDANVWNDLFDDDDMENVVMDTHQYLAWSGNQDEVWRYCDTLGNQLNPRFDIKYPVWVGEWALATEPCAHWLGGFNDGGDDRCSWVDCPAADNYLPDDVAVDFDRSVDLMGPFGGSDKSCIRNGQCSTDSFRYSDADIQTLGTCSMNVWNGVVDGHFLWTARNEIEDRWNYVTAYDKGWIQQPAQTFLQ